jgi:hypothetical protein
VEIDLNALRRAREFYDEHPHLFSSYKSFRYWLDHRASNGLIATSAVVETRFGLLIDPKKFASWMASRPEQQRPAA